MKAKNEQKSELFKRLKTKIVHNRYVKVKNEQKEIYNSVAETKNKKVKRKCDNKALLKQSCSKMHYKRKANNGMIVTVQVGRSIYC